MASTKMKTGKALKTARVLVAEIPADGTVAELKSEGKKKVAVPREGDLVDVHSQVLGVHGLHLVLEPDGEGVRIQTPGSHEVKRVSQEDIETVFRRV